MKTKQGTLFCKALTILIIFSFCSMLSAAILINEFLASNATQYIDKDFVEYSDWIELYNSGIDSVDIGDFYLSDDLSELEKWRIPSGTSIPGQSYLLFWADGNDTLNHTSFKLKSTGESLGLYDKNKICIDSVKFDIQSTDVSMGRLHNSLDTWAYFGEPTPKKPNTTFHSSHKNNKVLPPIFSIKAGLYLTEQTLNISSETDSGIVRYTLNGSKPTSVSKIFKSSIVINKTTVVRAICFKPKCIPSSIITQTYLINENVGIPVLSLAIDSLNLWDEHIGMYTIGTNGIEKYGVTANYHQEWGHPVSVEFYENDGTNDGFSVNGVIKVAGERRNMLQKSFKIQIKEKYGTDEIQYPLFSEKDIRSFKWLFIRNSGYSDFRFTMMRDGIVHSLIGSALDIDYLAYKPVILFINGQYWGLYNLREKTNEKYLATNHGVDPVNIDMVENKGVINAGEINDWNSLNNFLSTNTMNTTQSYDYINKNIDLHEWYNVFLTEIYFANTDWPGNNNELWKPKIENGKWRWIALDFDVAFGLWKDFSFNMIEFATDPASTNWANPPWSTFLQIKLLENDKIKNESCQKMAAHLNSTFSSDRVIRFIDSLQTYILPEMPRQIEKWGKDCVINDSDCKDGCVIGSMDEWYGQVERLQVFAKKRKTFIYNNFAKKYGLETAKLKIIFSHSNRGRVFVNDIEVAHDSCVGDYFKELPLRIKVIPYSGYSFFKNNALFNGTDSTIIKLNGDSIISLEFNITKQTILQETIKTNKLLLKSESPYIVINNLIIDSNAILTIEPGVEVLMNSGSNIIVYGSINAKGTEGGLITIKANKKAGVTSWGAICLNQARDTSVFEYAHINDGSSIPNSPVFIATLSSYKSNLILRNSSVTGKK